MTKEVELLVAVMELTVVQEACNIQYVPHSTQQVHDVKISVFVVPLLTLNIKSKLLDCLPLPSSYYYHCFWYGAITILEPMISLINFRC